MYSRVAATATAADTWTRRPVIRGLHSSNYFSAQRKHFLGDTLGKLSR